MPMKATTYQISHNDNGDDNDDDYDNNNGVFEA